MTTDPAASMRIWAVELYLGGRDFEIPALPAADWLPVLMEGDLTAILDWVEDPGLDEMVISGEIEPAELGASLDMAVERIAGRSIHQAIVLAQAARIQWTVVGGDLARRGFRWDEVPLAAAFDAIHVTLLSYLRSTATPEEARAGTPSPAERFQALMDQEPGETAQTDRRRPDRKKALAQHEEMAGPRPNPVPVSVKATSGPSGGGPPRSRQQPRQRPRAGR